MVERDLKLALARKHFELHFQPIYEIGGDELVGCEALLRWNHPKRGIVAPGEARTKATNKDLFND